MNQTDLLLGLVEEHRAHDRHVGAAHGGGQILEQRQPHVLAEQRVGLQVG